MGSRSNLRFNAHKQRTNDITSGWQNIEVPAQSEVTGDILVVEKRKTWQELYRASPEAVEASKQAWYVIPGASRSSYRESMMPPGTDGRLQLAFTMCQLAMGSYGHLDLEALAEEARQFIKERLPRAERKRRIEAQAAAYPVLFEAYTQGGMDGVYNRAGLSDGERRVATLWFQHPEGAIDNIKLRDEEIARVMNYKNADSVRQQRHRVTKKLQALTKEEKA